MLYPLGGNRYQLLLSVLTHYSSPSLEEGGQRVLSEDRKSGVWGTMQKTKWELLQVSMAETLDR